MHPKKTAITSINGLLQSDNTSIRVSVDELLRALYKAQRKQKKEEAKALRGLERKKARYRQQVAKHLEAKAKALLRYATQIRDGKKTPDSYYTRLGRLPTLHEPAKPRMVSNEIESLIALLRQRADGKQIVSVKIRELRNYMTVAKAPVECKC